MAHLHSIDVVLADDSEHFRRGLAAVLATEPDFTVVGEASDGDGAVEIVGRLVPDVVILDLRMPGTGGVAATAAIRALSPVTKVVILTVSDDDADLLAAIVAGAHGFLLKDDDIEGIPVAIREVVNGGAPLSPTAAAALWAEYAELLKAGLVVSSALRPSEQRVLRLLSEGVTTGQIAAGMGVPTSVVTHQASDVLEKVHLASRLRRLDRPNRRRPPR